MNDGIAQSVALITGASAGLGSEFAQQLAARGMNIALVARRQEKLQTLAAQLREDYGVEVWCFACDLSDGQAVTKLISDISSTQLQVDFLVNNAGSGGPKFFPAQSNSHPDAQDWQAFEAFNQLMMGSVMALCYAYVPAMVKRGRGRVINVASFAGLFSVPGEVVYGPAKQFVVGFSESLGLTVKQHGVHVCALCPGFVHTEFHDGEELQAMKAGTPKFIWYNADVVVREALAAVERGKIVFASGRLYRWAARALRFTPLRRFIQFIVARNVELH